LILPVHRKGAGFSRRSSLGEQHLAAARDSAVEEAVDEVFPKLTRRSVTSGTDREGWLRGRAAADLAPPHGTAR
jgi:hypothetical protein